MSNCVNRLKMDALEWMKKLAKCNHDCKIDCLLESFNKVVAERDELLEKQKPVEPRVIRKDELWNLPGGSVVWMEERTITEEYPEPVIPVCFEDIQDVTIGNNPKVHSAIAFNGRYDRMDQYDTMYRFWTARPTEEQRREEKWEEQMT